MVVDFRPLPSIFSTAVSHLLSLRGSFLLPRVHRAQGKTKATWVRKAPLCSHKGHKWGSSTFQRPRIPSPFTKVSFEAFHWDACRARGLGCGIKAQRQSASLYFLYFVLSIWDQRRVRREKDDEQGENWVNTNTFLPNCPNLENQTSTKSEVWWERATWKDQVWDTSKISNWPKEGNFF